MKDERTLTDPVRLDLHFAYVGDGQSYVRAPKNRDVSVIIVHINVEFLASLKDAVRCAQDMDMSL